MLEYQVGGLHVPLRWVQAAAVICNAIVIGKLIDFKTVQTHSCYPAS